jgi:hypothetical protein
VSNALGIAATTATLCGLLRKGLGIQEVTARSLDKARDGIDGDQVNLFLYQTLPDAAWRNMDIPRQVKPGETGQPPLPLVLYYLVTAYNADNDDTKSHILLGRAMSILHDHCLLGADEICNFSENAVGDSKLDEQAERVRITLQPLTLDEMSKLWSPFQTQYRLSVAYQVSVVLIESTRPLRSPLPVLTRGPSDRGVVTMTGALPALEEVRVPFSGQFGESDDVRLARALPSAQLGDELALLGQNLAGGSVRVLFKHPRVEQPFLAQIVRATERVIIAKLPAPGTPADPASATATWPAGFYTAQVITSQGGEPERASNEIAFSLAPTIAISPNTAPAGDIALTVTCAPMVRREQRAALLFRDGEIVVPTPAEAAPAMTQTLNFNLTAVPAGTPEEYVVRLRVDGVDSIPIDRAAATPRFAANQRIRVT